MRVKGTMEEKRNITFIIGNGFDLKYKLKTSYKHFLDEYLEIPSANGSIDAFKETIRAEKDERGYGNWSDLERQMGRYEPNTLAEFVECYDDIVGAMADYLRRTVRENIGLNADDIKNIPHFADGSPDIGNVRYGDAAFQGFRDLRVIDVLDKASDLLFRNIPCHRAAHCADKNAV